MGDLYGDDFLQVKEVAQFQVILRKDGTTFRILLRGNGFSGEREATVRGLLAHFLGDTEVDLEWWSHIPLTKEGKLVQAYRES